MLSNNPLFFISTVAIFLISLSVHEFAHAWVAYRFGDQTAKSMGRLTLNPIAHIDLFGTIILPLLVGFGWAKPVPVDFRVLNRRQVFLVAAAGPLSNILLAVILAIAFHILPLQAVPVLQNFILLAILFNLVLAIFNLIPIPPLDGSRMVFARLKSPRVINMYRNISRFGIFILIAFLWLGGFGIVVMPLVGLFYSLLRLPLPALTIEQAEPENENRTGNVKGVMAMLKKRISTPVAGHNKSFPSYRKQSSGGTIINIIVALVFFGLIAFAVMWVLKSTGDMSRQYFQGMSDSKSKATDLKCQMNMHAIWQSLQTYIISNNSFPESTDELVDWCGSTRLFQCPDPNGQKYIYIPGQNGNMPGQNILLYEPNAVHDGHSNVLRLSGQIDALTPEELNAALMMTMTSFKR